MEADTSGVLAGFTGFWAGAGFASACIGLDDEAAGSNRLDTDAGVWGVVAAGAAVCGLAWVAVGAGIDAAGLLGAAWVAGALAEDPE